GDAGEEPTLAGWAGFDFVENGVAQVFPERDEPGEFAAVRKQVPAVESFGAEVAGGAETVLQEREEFVVGARLRGGPFLAVEEGGAVFDEAEIDGWVFVNEPAGTCADEGAEDREAPVGGLEIRGGGRRAQEVVVVEIDE